MCDDEKKRKTSGPIAVPRAEKGHFQAVFHENRQKYEKRLWVRQIEGKNPLFWAKKPQIAWDSLGKVIVLRIPLGKGDQLLRLFGTWNRPFLGPFWEIREKYPWVNEILLRNINYSLTLVDFVTCLNSIDCDEKKRKTSGPIAVPRAEKGQKQAVFHGFG